MGSPRSSSVTLESTGPACYLVLLGFSLGRRRWRSVWAGSYQMKLVTWNVNGIRSILQKGFLDFVVQEQPDVICLQEIKAHPEQVGLELNGYHQYWNPAEKKGYSGTAIFSRIKPLQVVIGLEEHIADVEGRVQAAEFPDFYLVNVYTPNAKRDLARLDYRTLEWDVAFLQYLKKLEEIKPVIFCGDLNVAHKEIDLANPKTNVKNAGFTPQERAAFDQIIQSGFLDCFRELNPEPGHYTWWSYMNRARERNIGWRIDYFCMSPALRPRLHTARILCDVQGSDHCPVAIELHVAATGK
jgi:exodeoxyribonuclease III